jgi:hypothetical protein
LLHAGTQTGRSAALGSGGRRGSYGARLLAALGTSPKPAGTQVFSFEA